MISLLLILGVQVASIAHRQYVAVKYQSPCCCTKTPQTHTLSLTERAQVQKEDTEAPIEVVKRRPILPEGL